MMEKKELDIGISKYTRDKVIDHLKYSFTHDLLDEVDFEKRLSIAINTKNKKDLDTIINDLPKMTEDQKNKAVTTELNINTGNITEKGKIVSILGSAERKGIWKPAKKLDVNVILGAAELDFTEAVLPPGIIDIKVSCIMGSVNIIVPNGVNVDNQCSAILGGVDEESIYKEENSNNPTLRITGTVIMGGLEIKTPKEGLLKRILKKLGIN